MRRAGAESRFHSCRPRCADHDDPAGGQPRVQVMQFSAPAPGAQICLCDFGLLGQRRERRWAPRCSEGGRGRSHHGHIAERPPKGDRRGRHQPPLDSRLPPLTVHRLGEQCGQSVHRTGGWTATQRYQLRHGRDEDTDEGHHESWENEGITALNRRQVIMPTRSTRGRQPPGPGPRRKAPGPMPTCP